MFIWSAVSHTRTGLMPFCWSPSYRFIANVQSNGNVLIHRIETANLTTKIAFYLQRKKRSLSQTIRTRIRILHYIADVTENEIKKLWKTRPKSKFTHTHTIQASINLAREWIWRRGKINVKKTKQKYDNQLNWWNENGNVNFYKYTQNGIAIDKMKNGQQPAIWLLSKRTTCESYRFLCHFISLFCNAKT